VYFVIFDLIASNAEVRHTAVCRFFMYGGTGVPPSFSVQRTHPLFIRNFRVFIFNRNKFQLKMFWLAVWW
jgi:hypothetical protein